MFPYSISEAGVFRIDDVDFHIDMSPANRRKSEPNSFTLVKNEAYLNLYANLAKTTQPTTILELGIFQGGSFVLLDKLFKPARLAALDHAPEPIAPLMDYCARHPHRHAHFATSQTDAEKLNTIVNDDLGGALDMVVDDASHVYALTRRSFELLFPKLAPGGTYIIEDWGWSHMPAYQSETSPWHDKPALTNLLYELIALHASTGYIAELRFWKPLMIVRKSPTSGDVPADFMSELKLRGRAMPQI